MRGNSRFAQLRRSVGGGRGDCCREPGMVCLCAAPTLLCNAEESERVERGAGPAPVEGEPRRARCRDAWTDRRSVGRVSTTAEASVGAPASWARAATRTRFIITGLTPTTSAGFSPGESHFATARALRPTWQESGPRTSRERLCTSEVAACQTTQATPDWVRRRSPSLTGRQAAVPGCTAPARSRRVALVQPTQKRLAVCETWQQIRKV
jgi:hypothetical protein